MSETTSVAAPASLSHVQEQMRRRALEAGLTESPVAPAIVAPPIEPASDVRPAVPARNGIRVEAMPVAAPVVELDADPFEVVRTAALARLKELHDRPVVEGGEEEKRTVSPETENLYRRRALNMKRRFILETMIDPNMADPVEFAHWFLARRSGYKASSWRFMRQVALYAVSGFSDADAVAAATALIVSDSPQDAHMSSETAVPGKRKGVTSADKQKYVDHDDLVRLEMHARMRSKGEGPMTAVEILKCCIATGLRPSEWASTIVSDVPDPDEPRRGARVYLFVLNAKATHGRGNGTMRTIDVTKFTETTLGDIRRLSVKGAQWEAAGEFESNMDECSQALYRMTRKLWPRRARCYALYSGRHQFKLNMSALELHPEEISALMGHNVTETHSKHYGVKNRQWSIDKILDRPVPVADEVATVRHTFEHYKMRQEMLRIASGRKPVVEQEIEEHGTDVGFRRIEGI